MGNPTIDMAIEPSSENYVPLQPNHTVCWQGRKIHLAAVLATSLLVGTIVGVSLTILLPFAVILDPDATIPDDIYAAFPISIITGVMTGGFLTPALCIISKDKIFPCLKPVEENTSEGLGENESDTELLNPAEESAV